MFFRIFTNVYVDKFKYFESILLISDLTKSCLKYFFLREQQKDFLANPAANLIRHQTAAFGRISWSVVSSDRVKVRVPGVGGGLAVTKPTLFVDCHVATAGGRRGLVVDSLVCMTWFGGGEVEKTSASFFFHSSNPQNPEFWP